MKRKTNEQKVLAILNESGRKGVTIGDIAGKLLMTESHARVVLSDLAKKGKAHSVPVRWKIGASEPS